MQNKENGFPIQIVKIKQTAFFIDEKINLNPEELHGFKLDFKTAFNLESSLFEFKLRITFTPEKNSEIIFMRSEIENVFFIKELEKYLNPANPNEIDLPSDVLITIVSLAISHSRAIAACNIGGTVYDGMILPILNSIDVATNFFGDKIKVHTKT